MDEAWKRLLEAAKALIEDMDRRALEGYCTERDYYDALVAAIEGVSSEGAAE